MPAPLHEDAVAYLKQNNMPINTQSLNRTMQLLGQRSDLRPSYSGASGDMDIDMNNMSPIQSSPLPPLKQSNTSSPSRQSFGAAFADARKRLGASGEFEWNGRKYNTKYKDEVQTETPQKTPGINKEAGTETQEDLLMEKSGADQIDQRQEDSSSAPYYPSRGSANYAEYKKADDEMDNLITALGATAAGGAAVAGGAYAANRNRNKPRQMSRADLYAQSENERLGKRSMSDEDLYGKRPQSMTDEDIFFDEQTRKMVPGDIQMSMQDELEHDARTGVFVDEEIEAVEALRKNDKAAARRLLPQLKQLGGDRRLITALKAIL